MSKLLMVHNRIVARFSFMSVVPLAAWDAYLRRIVKILIDVAACTGAVVISYLLRFSLPEAIVRFQEKLHIWLLIIGLEIMGFALLRLYSAFWRYTGNQSLMKLAAVVSFSLVFTMGLCQALNLPVPPRSAVVLTWFLTIALCAGVRLSIRQRHARRSRRTRPSEADAARADLRRGQRGRKPAAVD